MTNTTAVKITLSMGMVWTIVYIKIHIISLSTLAIRLLSQSYLKVDKVLNRRSRWTLCWVLLRFIADTSSRSVD